MARTYQELAFHKSLSRALERVRVVLDANKKPQFAEHVHHQYADKYLLAESMTQTAIASQLNCMALLGVSPDQLRQLCGWSKMEAVSLRFKAAEEWDFDHEETREVESPTKHVLEVTHGDGAPGATLTSKVVHTVTDHFWKATVKYQLHGIRGVGASPDDQLVVFVRDGSDVVKGSSKTSPPRVPQEHGYEVNISWLLRHVQEDTLTPAFRIDREHTKCHTPRRNLDVDAAMAHFAQFGTWSARFMAALSSFFTIKPDSRVDVDLNVVAQGVLVPVLPYLEDRESSSVAEAAAAAAPAEAGALALVTLEDRPGGLLLSLADRNKLLSEEARSLRESCAKLSEKFPASTGDHGGPLATVAEAAVALVLRHLHEVCIQYPEAVDYIESMLRKQLVAAIGKEVTPADFAEYMRFHNRKLFDEAYAPVPFCFAVRRSDSHSPEGTVSIEQVVVGGGGDSNIAEPIVTISARGAGSHSMQFPLSASTNVTFGGDRYLHAWLAHQFSGESGAQLSLVSRARQFSSMLVLVGRIASAQVFEPKFAAIVQNKDELTIPLDLSTIPTPKEFKDAIASLSPEQQKFAQAFRAMQLESTLFGVLVIQIKPQLERVLNLPDDSLTKEIKLTQDLMQLFIKFQIPSDLLSFDAGAAAADGIELVAPTPQERLEAVKGHVKAMQEMIEKAKEEELHDRKQEAQFVAPLSGRLSGFGFAEAGGCFQSSCSKGAESFDCFEAAGCSAMPLMECMDFKVKAAPAAPPTLFGAPAPQPLSQPSQQPQQRQQQQTPQAQQAGGGGGTSDRVVGGGRDFTQVPKEMDARFEQLDRDAALRPTIITPGDTWTKKAQKALLAAPSISSLGSDEQKQEKDAAFDLLDALTKSGALTLEHASLHVVVAATHCFDKTVTETVVQGNVNPIDKVERSTLIMATTVHQLPAAALIREAQRERVCDTSPMLFLEDGATGAAA